MPGLSPRQKVKKGRPLLGFPNTPPVVNITAFPATPTVNVGTGGYTATATDAEQGDLSANIIWIGRTALATAGSQVADFSGGVVGGNATGLAADTAGTATAAVAGAPAGTVVPALAAANYDFDVTIDGGGLQQLTVAVGVADDYDAIALAMNAVIVGGTCAFVGGAFEITSNSTGVSSTVVVAAGTAGSGGGDLFAAITAQATGNPAVTFPAPVNGTSTTYTASVVVDGGSAQPISIVGEDAQTFTDLITELTADTTGATWTIDGGNIKLESNTTGATSTIAITDTGLFAALTGFSSILAAVGGVDETTGQVGTGPTPTITLTTLGSQTIRAEVTDSFALTGFDTETLTVVV